MITKNEQGYDILKYTAKELREMTLDQLWEQDALLSKINLSWPGRYGWAHPDNKKAGYKLNAEIMRRTNN